MTFKMSDEAQTIKVFNLSAETNEFIGTGDAWIPAHTGLPANCTNIEPPKAQDGKVAVFDFIDSSWDLVDDYRGVTVFNTLTGEPVYISELGALPKDTTLVAPDGPYQKWNGETWVQDDEAYTQGMLNEAEKHRQELLIAANETVSDWRVELQLGIISDEDKTMLIEWMTYIKKLKTMNLSNITDQDSYGALVWPDQP
ncbi:tail fiber assembly protein [Enterobacter hormaechei]|uniref:tail fiber assembly protein n=1 Tax=Enterobacter hormaechei TaxID=158836 RepID=UPI002247E9E6|nr:tail fiber assembly protein [Enterobacter hormaechei]UZQ57509.1 tail fiber assembly protein [Enterobacter hormaechei]